MRLIQRLPSFFLGIMVVIATMAVVVGDIRPSLKRISLPDKEIVSKADRDVLHASSKFSSALDEEYVRIDTEVRERRTREILG